jgi:hypothetical protein
MEELEKITIVDHLVLASNLIVMNYEGIKPDLFFPRNFP